MMRRAGTATREKARIMTRTIRGRDLTGQGGARTFNRLTKPAELRWSRPWGPFSRPACHIRRPMLRTGVRSSAMKAVLCRSFGGPETLVVEDVPEPRPGPGEAGVRGRLPRGDFF